MTDEISDFYDRLSDDYTLLFKDWDAAVRWQGEVVDRLLRAELGDGPLRALDCACGIGTQALGLARREGWAVTGTDISPREVERARAEADRLGIEATFAVADMRELAAATGATFDAVLAFDNAIPHLLTDTDLAQAAASIYDRLRDGGLFAASIRDYDALLTEKPEATSHRVVHTPAGRRVLFQVWDWHDDRYTVTQFIVQETADDWTTRHASTVYRALRREHISATLTGAGFRSVRWAFPDETGYYQPVVLAVR